MTQLRWLPRVGAAVLCVCVLGVTMGAATATGTAEIQAERSVAPAQGEALSESPTDDPTRTATSTPTDDPTETPTQTPTDDPTETPTGTPTDDPTETPTQTPTDDPTETPTQTPTDDPTRTATSTPTDDLIESPTSTPTDDPTSRTSEPEDSPTAEESGGGDHRNGDEREGGNGTPVGGDGDGSGPSATGDAGGPNSPGMVDLMASPVTWGGSMLAGGLALLFVALWRHRKPAPAGPGYAQDGGVAEQSPAGFVPGFGYAPEPEPGPVPPGFGPDQVAAPEDAVVDPYAHPPAFGSVTDVRRAAEESQGETTSAVPAPMGEQSPFAPPLTGIVDQPLSHDRGQPADQHDPVGPAESVSPQGRAGGSGRAESAGEIDPDESDPFDLAMEGDTEADSTGRIDEQRGDPNDTWRFESVAESDVGAESIEPDTPDSESATPPEPESFDPPTDQGTPSGSAGPPSTSNSPEDRLANLLYAANELARKEDEGDDRDSGDQG